MCPHLVYKYNQCQKLFLNVVVQVSSEISKGNKNIALQLITKQLPVCPFLKVSESCTKDNVLGKPDESERWWHVDVRAMGGDSLCAFCLSF